MEISYICALNPNEKSSINGEFPEFWIRELKDQILRLILSNLKGKCKKDCLCGLALPSMKKIIGMKEEQIHNFFFSKDFEDFLYLSAMCVFIDFPKCTDNLIHLGCLAYVLKEEEPLFTLQYIKDENGCWFIGVV